MTRSGFLGVLIAAFCFLSWWQPGCSRAKPYRWRFETRQPVPAMPARVEKNALIGVGDTVTAFLSGQVLRGNEPQPQVVVYFQDSAGQWLKTDTTDANGLFALHVPTHVTRVGVAARTVGDGHFPLRLGFGDIRSLHLQLGRDSTTVVHAAEGSQKTPYRKLKQAVEALEPFPFDTCTALD